MAYAPIPTPLPSGWHAKRDKTTGRIYFANDNTRKTQWDDPRPLPDGWEEKSDMTTRQKYFANHYLKTTQWNDPRPPFILGDEKPMLPPLGMGGTFPLGQQVMPNLSLGGPASSPLPPTNPIIPRTPSREGTQGKVGNATNNINYSNLARVGSRGSPINHSLQASYVEPDQKEGEGEGQSIEGADKTAEIKSDAPSGVVTPDGASSSSSSSTSSISSANLMRRVSGSGSSLVIANSNDGIHYHTHGDDFDWYKDVLKISMADKAITPEEDQLLQQIRTKLKISDEEHKQILTEFGYDERQFEALKKSETGRECVICLDAQSTHIIIPCMHICLCENCAKIYDKSDCPKCRTKVDKISKTY